MIDCKHAKNCGLKDKVICGLNEFFQPHELVCMTICGKRESLQKKSISQEIAIKKQGCGCNRKK